MKWKSKLAFPGLVLCLALCLLGIPVLGAEDAAVKEWFYGFPGSKDTLSVKTPADWQESFEKGPKGSLLNVSYRPSSGPEFEIHFTVFAGSPKIDIQDLAAKMGEPLLPTAVETELNLAEVRSETVQGYWYRITDKTLVGKPPEKDNYLYLINAALTVQKYLVIVTALTNDPGQGFINGMMEMMGSFRVE